MNYDNCPVRRQDRLLPEEEAVTLLRDGAYGFLSMVSLENTGYGIPLSYVLEKDRIYFHCAPQGEKLRALARNNRVSFCVVGATRILPSRFTTAYESVIAKGTVTVDLPDEEKMHALELILNKYAPDDQETGLKYAAKSFHRTHILRLNIETLSGKSKKSP